MNEFSENYKNLKDQIPDNDSKVIPYLIFGIVIGRIFEKIIRTKKRIFKKNLRFEVIKFPSTITSQIFITLLRFWLLMYTREPLIELPHVKHSYSDNAVDVGTFTCPVLE